jgi:adenylate kinase
MDYVLFGIQGSGKGTQAKILQEKFGFAIFETGAQLRKLSASESELGKKIKSIIDAGHLVPSEIVIEIVRNFLNSHNPNQAIIFDGVPRKIDQAIMFDQLMKEFKRDFSCVYFELSEEKAVERLLERGRHDDNPESIKNRIHAFFNETLPMVDKYSEENKLAKINGDQTINEVATNLEATIKTND